MKNSLLSIFAVAFALSYVGCKPHTTDPSVTERQSASVTDSIVGQWADLHSMDPGEGNRVALLEINEDGSFVGTTIGFLLREKNGSDGSVIPAGSEIEDSEEGKVDLATGEVQLSNHQREQGIKSKRFYLKEGRLWLETTTVGVCDDAVSYGRIH